MTLESQLHEAFVSFAAAALPPYARERELVSAFVFVHLLATLRSGAVISTPGQIGIEVAVPQRRDRPNPRRDPDVCKDVVIWPTPGMVCWDAEGRAVHYPLAVLEWKSINRKDRSSTSRTKRLRDHPDLEWLRWLVAEAQTAEGYAVLVDVTASPPVCSVHRVTATEDNARWFVAPDDA